jgi:hypothetical protein
MDVCAVLNAVGMEGVVTVKLAEISFCLIVQGGAGRVA